MSHILDIQTHLTLGHFGLRCIHFFTNSTPRRSGSTTGHTIPAPGIQRLRYCASPGCWPRIRNTGSWKKNPWYQLKICWCPLMSRIKSKIMLLSVWWWWWWWWRWWWWWWFIMASSLQPFSASHPVPNCDPETSCKARRLTLFFRAVRRKASAARLVFLEKERE